MSWPRLGPLAVLMLIVVGFAFGYAPLGSNLAGAIAVGALMAVFLANSGGPWDNAKKLVEDGNYGGKDSDAHAATVIGDTVGDPFEDTAGRSGGFRPASPRPPRACRLTGCKHSARLRGPPSATFGRPGGWQTHHVLPAEQPDHQDCQRQSAAERVPAGHDGRRGPISTAPGKQPGSRADQECEQQRHGEPERQQVVRRPRGIGQCSLLVMGARRWDGGDVERA